MLSQRPSAGDHSFICNLIYAVVASLPRCIYLSYSRHRPVATFPRWTNAMPNSLAVSAPLRRNGRQAQAAPKTSSVTSDSINVFTDWAAAKLQTSHILVAAVFMNYRRQRRRHHRSIAQDSKH